MTAGPILVTGGTGFIGSAVVEQLAALDRDVHVVSSRAHADSQAKLHRADLLEPREVAHVIDKVQPSQLIHLAWYVEPGQVWNSTENLRWVSATLELLQRFAEGGGSRAVLAGTCSEYGPHAGVCVEDETPLAPSNLYGTAKLAVGETAIAGASHLGVSVAWARIFSAYGPREHPSRLISSVTRHLLLGEEAPCSIGTQRRDYLSTSEMARALISLLDSDITGAINVASGVPVELRDLIGRIATLVGRPELVRFGAVTPPPDDPPVLVADVTKLAREVGWHQRETLDEGLERTVDWWRQELDR